MKLLKFLLLATVAYSRVTLRGYQKGTKAHAESTECQDPDFDTADATGSMGFRGFNFGNESSLSNWKMSAALHEKKPKGEDSTMRTLYRWWLDAPTSLSVESLPFRGCITTFVTAQPKVSTKPNDMEQSCAGIIPDTCASAMIKATEQIQFDISQDPCQDVMNQLDAPEVAQVCNPVFSRTISYHDTAFGNPNWFYDCPLNLTLGIGNTATRGAIGSAFGPPSDLFQTPEEWRKQEGLQTWIGKAAPILMTAFATDQNQTGKKADSRLLCVTIDSPS